MPFIISSFIYDAMYKGESKASPVQSFLPKGNSTSSLYSVKEINTAHTFCFAIVLPCLKSELLNVLALETFLHFCCNCASPKNKHRLLTFSKLASESQAAEDTPLDALARQ